MALYVFVSGKADHPSVDSDRVQALENTEKIRQVQQIIENSNEIWRSWVLGEGEVIKIEGASFQLKVPAQKLKELPGLREQYAKAIDTTVSVGVGAKLHESEQALKAAKNTGGDKIRLFDASVQEDLKELSKADGPAAVKNPPASAMTGAPNQEMPPDSQQAQPEQPVDENQLHDVLNNVAQQQSQPQEPPQQEQEEPSGPDIKEKVAKILQVFKARAQELESLQQSDPELYKSLVGILQAMVEMARPPEQVQKNDKIELDASKTPPKKEALSKDLMPGGKGDDAEDSEFDPEQLKAGTKIEMEEHGLDEARAKEVCKDHLSENKSYYAKDLEKRAFPVGSQVGMHIKVKTPATGRLHPTTGELVNPSEDKTQWHQAMSGKVLGTKTGAPTSSLRPTGKA